MNATTWPRPIRTALPGWAVSWTTGLKTWNATGAASQTAFRHRGRLAHGVEREGEKKGK